MAKLKRRSVFWLSGLLVPFVTLLSPKWLSLAGVGPCWAVLWLLPWSLEEGIISAVISGFFLGLILDAISIDGPTLIPGLVVLGFWWGWLGRYGSEIEGTLNLGLLAWLGSVIYSLSIWLQISFIHSAFLNNPISGWAWQTLLIQATLTAVLAPLISSWFLLRLRDRKF